MQKFYMIVADYGVCNRNVRLVGAELEANELCDILNNEVSRTTTP